MTEPAQEPTGPRIGAVEKAMATVARRLGWTTGEAYTAVIGVVVALSLLFLGLPAALRTAPELASRAEASPTTTTVVPTTTTTTPVSTTPKIDVSKRLTDAIRDLLPASTMPTTTTTTTTTTPRDPEPPDEPTALVITKATWASARAALPAALDPMPEGLLPVGVLGGNDDKRSFVELDGTRHTFGLVVSSDQAANRLVDQAAVQACVVTASSWDAGARVAYADAPAFDDEQCVDGSYDATARVFRFDLADLTFPAGSRRSVALVPVVAPGASWQVAFTTTAD